MNPKIGNPSQVCAVTRSQIVDGPAQGMRIIDVTNGKLHFVLSESNALDVYRLWHEGVNVGFVSKNGLYSGEGGFMHDFPAGMVYTCGLDAIGGVEGHRPHGRFHTIPATVVEIKADDTGVKIVGEIRVTQLFGENLIVRRTIETAAYSDELTLTDEITNRAFRDEKWVQLYHVNVGYPIVDAGAKISGKFKKSLPRNEWAGKCAGKMLEMESPVDNWQENCFFHETADGQMSITNRKLGKCFTVKSNLKKFVEWKSRASGDYVVGLEPGTSWLDGHLKYSTLKSGAKAVNRLTLRVENV